MFTSGEHSLTATKDGKTVAPIVSFIKKHSIEALLVLIGILLSQAGFDLLMAQSEASIVASVGSILRQEETIGNPYRISKEVESLEGLNLISCVKLRNETAKSAYLDTAYKKDCGHSAWLFTGQRMSSSLLSGFGQTWKIEADVKVSVFLCLVLWAFRFSLIAIFLYALNFHRLRVKTLHQEAKFEISKLEAVALMAQQVAHDIRSPLSALSIVAMTVDDLAPEKRDLIKNAVGRISDIANDLLKRGRQNPVSEKAPVQVDNEDSTPLLLDELVEGILSEKKVLLADCSIHLESSRQGQGHWILASRKEMGRVLSNLINNSLEAFDGEKGQVTVSLREMNEQVVLVVQDNGKGIPPEIVAQLGQVGASFGKEGTSSGSGLGVAHARHYVESLGGKFEILSQVGMGTMMQLHFKKALVL